MTNKEISNIFREMGDLMELHKDNPFKIRSYKNAYITLRKLGKPITETPLSELASIKGIGKSTIKNIEEILTNGKMEALENIKEKTPKGVQELLKIKGFGPSKIRQLWQELGAESPIEVLYACNENRLISLKGFGQKTQAELKNKIEYFIQSRDKFHFATIYAEAQNVISHIAKILPNTVVKEVGKLRRRSIILEKIELLIAKMDVSSLFDEIHLVLEEQKQGIYFVRTSNNYPLVIYTCTPENFGSKYFRHTGTKAFLTDFLQRSEAIDFRQISNENKIFEKAKLPFIPAELREDNIEEYYWKNPPDIINTSDIKGILHTHTTYSDGLHTLEDMARHTQSLGYEYIGISDHSKAAFYANGLKEDRVLQQFAEIDILNKQLAPFKIYKSIESDILNDGSLDYEPDILKQFDFVIASIHSNLRMDEQKATSRLITAIENPYTRILGHPTGRLLLARKGYPVDFQKIIDACAANGVVIELNANPYRLDLDWSWIQKAINKGVKIAINPDAHSKEGINDVFFGVQAARKGGLEAINCLNVLNREEFETWINK